MIISDGMQYWATQGKNNRCPVVKPEVRELSILINLWPCCPSAEWKECFCLALQVVKVNSYSGLAMGSTIEKPRENSVLGTV